MEKQEKEFILTNEFFNKYPFIISLKKGNVTQEELNDIYLKSENFTRTIDIIINGENYKISFIDKDKELIDIYFSQNKKVILLLDECFKQPKKIEFLNIDNLKIKTMNIFRNLTFSAIQKLKIKYEVNINQNNIIIKEKMNIIPKNIFEVHQYFYENINKFKSLIEQKEGEYEINPLLLSSNFNDFFPEIKIEDTFTFILNEQRIRFFNKINEFVKTNKIYYWIVGSDGIGKSLSLLYYSKFLNHKIIYFNLKLYANCGSIEEIKKYIHADFHKLFIKNVYTGDFKIFESDSLENAINNNFNAAIKAIEKEVNHNLSPMLFFWEYLFAFIKSSHCEEKTLIILDQYSSDKSDPNSKYLINIINHINNFKNSNKLIISSSINNTGNKYELIKSITNYFGLLENKNFTNLLLKSYEKEDNQNIIKFKSESNNYEESEEEELFDNIEEIETKENDIGKKNNETISSHLKVNEKTKIDNKNEDFDEKSVYDFCEIILNEEMEKKKKAL